MKITVETNTYAEVGKADIINKFEASPRLDKDRA